MQPPNGISMSFVKSKCVKDFYIVQADKKKKKNQHRGMTSLHFSAIQRK